MYRNKLIGSYRLFLFALCIKWFGISLDFCGMFYDLLSRWKDLDFSSPCQNGSCKREPAFFSVSCCYAFSPHLLLLKVLGSKLSTAKHTGGGLGGCYNLFLSWVWIGKEIMALLRLRAGDEKTTVRKSALQVQCSLHDFLFCVITQNATGTNN